MNPKNLGHETYDHALKKRSKVDAADKNTALTPDKQSIIEFGDANWKVCGLCHKRTPDTCYRKQSAGFKLLMCQSCFDHTNKLLSSLFRD